MRKCFGTSPRTGKGVGERHKWSGGWGLGRCVFCHRDLEQLTRAERKQPEAGSDAHLARARDEEGEHLWAAVFYEGAFKKDAETGFYVRRGPRWQTEWLINEETRRARRFETMAQATAAALQANSRLHEGMQG